jgi:hypothetical protein
VEAVPTWVRVAGWVAIAVILAGVAVLWRAGGDPWSGAGYLAFAAHGAVMASGTPARRRGWLVAALVLLAGSAVVIFVRALQVTRG